MILFCIHKRFYFSGCNESNQDESEHQEHLPDQYFMDYQHQNLEQHPDQDQDSNIDRDRDQEEIEDQDEDEYVYLARERDEVEVEYEDEDYEKELDLWEDLTNFVIEKNVPNNTTDALLQVLNKHKISGLPLTARTLLGTNTGFPVEEVSGMTLHRYDVASKFTEVLSR